eukprot:12447505-Heterocapsa_arctica.AAC.1
MFYGRPRERDGNAQLHWEVSLWESFFPRAKPQRTASPFETHGLGQGGSTTEGRGHLTNDTARNRK